MARYRQLPGSIWALGFGSLFMDASSELIHSLLPVFLVSVLGASTMVVGTLEGIASATVAITKVFSGAISDHFRKRKLLVVLGYGLSALTKPLFPLAAAVEWIFAARILDRVGKGIRGAPRDALVADIVPSEMRGAAYGLRQALDSVGAFIGPLLALAFMAWFANDIRMVFWIAVLPALISVAVLALAVSEPEQEHAPADGKKRLSWADAKQLPTRYWLVIGLGCVVTLARFSEAFLILRAQSLGISAGLVPAIMIVMNVAYAALAYPAGSAADRLHPRHLLLVGLGILIAAHVIFAAASAFVGAFVGAALWGAHLAFTEGLLAKLVADAAPARLRGTAFGLFNLANGGALLVAGVVAGWAWSAFGPPATFITGAVFALLAVIGLLVSAPPSKHLTSR